MVKNIKRMRYFLAFSLFILTVGAFWTGRAVSDSIRTDGQLTVGTSASTANRSESNRFASIYQSADFFEAAIGSAPVWANFPDSKVSSMVIPHHLLVADKIAGQLKSLAERQSPRQIIVLSPNHFNAGDQPVYVADAIWETPLGELESSPAMIDRIGMIDRNGVLKDEHGLANLMPFIKELFPEAEVMGIAVKEELTAEAADALGRELASKFPQALLLASVDMSHELPEYAAKFHDEVTAKVLAAGECDQECDVEADSVASLRTLFAFNEARGAQRFVPLYRDSSIDLGVTKLAEENTSHIGGVFVEGQADRSAWFSFHAVGDIMLDRGTRIVMDEEGVEAPWVNMSRFLRGVDLTFGNLEGTVNEQESTYTYDPPFRFVFDPEAVKIVGQYLDAVSLANNHSRDVGSKGEVESQQWLDRLGIPWFGGYTTPQPTYETSIRGVDVALIAYHQFSPNIEELKSTIATAKSAGKFVIVYPHWGTEYIHTPDSNQKYLAQIMVDSGADLIIGGHPHVWEVTEVIGDVPVLYSLGNFIFDQQIPQTYEALTVGGIISEDSIRLFLLPINSKGSQPRPMTDEEAQRLFERMGTESVTVKR